MRYIVFSCKKCGHNLYLENTDDLSRNLRKLSVKDCPECGEDGYCNWVLEGGSSSFPNEEEDL